VGTLGVALVADFGIGERVLQRQKDGLGGTQRIQHRSRFGHADGECTADVVVAADCDLDAPW
jgi:hypothetical protein